MRMLHTSDWHVGKPLRGRSRLDEQEAVKQQILEIIRDEKVGCVLVSGDLFDSQAPSPDAERLVYNFFAELLARDIPAVVIGGNHDHPKRLAALRKLLDQLKIYIRPEPVRPDCGGVIELTTKGECVRIAVLPFVPEKKIVDICKMMAPEDTWYTEYAERIAQMCQKLSESFSSKNVNVLLAHLFVSGAETSGTERAIHVAQPYAVSPQRLPATAHYIALGHLHRPQQVAAPSPCQYAGSPLQLDFGEQGQEKRVVIVDARPGKPAQIKSVVLSSGRRLRDISGTIEELEAQAQAFGDDFLRVTVKVAAPVLGIASRIRELLPDALDIQMDYPRSESPEKPEVGHMSPQGAFNEFYKAAHGAAPPEQLTRIFQELYDEVSHAAD
jgi:exonuclease SbcD